MNPLLHGHNPASHLVAVQQKGDQTIRLYRRVAGKISTEDVDFFPFFFLSHPSLLERYEKKHWLKELSGENFYKYLAVFTRWNDMWDAVRTALEQHNKDSPRRIENYAEAEFLLLRPDPVNQYLMQSGTTLFKEMEFGDLHRLQISMAVRAVKESRGVARRTEDRILAIAMTDTRGWEMVLDGRKLDEQALLTQFRDAILERDPDCIEGHQLFSRDLPYLLQRFELHQLECSIGRDGSVPRAFSPRGIWQETEGEGDLYELAGRHLIDLSVQAEQYDISRRALEHADLASLAHHFGFPEPTQAQIPLAAVSARWDEDPKQVLESLRQNTGIVSHLSEHLSPSGFYLTQMVPLSLGTVLRSGSTIKIESLMVREYLRQKHSVPRPTRGTQTTGGYADLFMSGVFENVVHADVESLYPSIILSRNIIPRSDALDVYRNLLKDLVQLRLETKHKMRAASGNERGRLDAMQSSFKILTNSFYGYLGYGRGLFNDYGKADEITKAGQELLKKIVKQIELYNGKVIEVDTDGVFFLPPDNVVGEEQEETLIRRISDSLPTGIRLVTAGRYRKMLSYKTKNYALLDHEGVLTVKGSSLISRSMERFLRRFLRLAVANLLDGNLEGLHHLFVSLRQNITEHAWDVADFCRTETIHDPFSVYEREVGEGKRNPGAVYEVARRAGILPRPGDRISYYVTGSGAHIKISENCRLAEEWDPNFADENTTYYLSRLEETASKFEVFFTSEDFRKVFATEDLFGFDPGSVRIISRRREAEEHADPGPVDDREEFKIWLGDTGD